MNVLVSGIFSRVGVCQTYFPIASEAHSMAGGGCIGLRVAELLWTPLKRLAPQIASDEKFPFTPFSWLFSQKARTKTNVWYSPSC